MKKVIITGAAGNLGKVTVKTFVEKGYDVIAIYSKEVSQNNLKEDRTFESYHVDATNETAVNSLIEEIILNHGQIDCMLMLIGGFSTGSINNTGVDDMVKMIDLNFYTAYNFARPVFNQMEKQGGGKMIFVGSEPAIDDKMGFDMIAYTLSKNAIVKLAKILNSKGIQKNIKASVIVPTTIDTPQNRLTMPDADFSKWTSAFEIATLMEFICSENGNKLKDLIVKI